VADGAGEAGAALAAAVGEDSVVTLGEGETDPEGVADDSGLAEVAGVVETAALADAWGEAAAAGEVVTAGEVVAFGSAAAFRTSLSRTPTLRSLLCLAVSTVRSKVSPKKIHPRYTVALVSTVAVWAPKMFSVTPLPKAAPNPSFFGRCISTTSVSRIQTIARIESRMGMTILSHIRAGIWCAVCRL
jgi:hypothetical protein